MKLGDIKSCAECPIFDAGLCHIYSYRVCDVLDPEQDVNEALADMTRQHERMENLYEDIND